MPVYGAFGIYRWLLATWVMVAHLSPIITSNADDFPLGTSAVWSFFILSGYTSCYILDNRYLPLKGGIGKYYLNRALRIYPLYWSAALASACAIIRFPAVAASLSGSMTLPPNRLSWVANIAIFGIAPQLNGWSMNHTLIPVAWSLAIEMDWWCIMPLLMKSEEVRAGLLKAAAGLFMLIVTFLPLLDMIYFTVLGGMIPFAAGVGCYQLLRDRKRKPSVRPALLSAVLLQVFFFCLLYARIFTHGIAFIITLITTSATLYFLSTVDNRSLPSPLKYLDERLGRLAYPMFLLGWFTGVMVNGFFPSLQFRSWPLFLVCWLVAHLFGLLLIRAVERPVERLRQRFKC